MVIIYGSFARSAERPNDIDVACKLIPRWRLEEEQREAEDFTRALHEGRFRNTTEAVAWPKLEVLRFFKNGSRSLSVQEIDGWVLTQKHIVVFREGIN